MDNHLIISALRRGFLTYPSRLDAINKAKRPGNKYECNCCHKLISRFGIECDHIEPVGSFENWNSYVAKLFVTVDKLQILCISCHREKTKTQNAKNLLIKRRQQKESSMTEVEKSRWDRKSLELAGVFD